MKHLADILGAVLFALAVFSVIGIPELQGTRAFGDEPRVESSSVSEPGKVTVYSPNADHPLNRLHAALFVRTARNGTVYGRDDIDPWYWPETRFLFTGDHHKRILKLLDELLAQGQSFVPAESLQRALLQHDLWSVFDWLSDPDVALEADPYSSQRRALQVRIAEMIRRLALPAKQIEELPDNYSMAVASHAFAEKFDADQPERAFLPADLFETGGPWVLLGEHMRTAAPAHLHFTTGRSAFLVFLNLPAGRSATLAYLEQLQKFPNPRLNEPGSQRLMLNPDLPQFPPGTQVALAREMLLVDSKGQLAATRLIQSLQLRLYGEFAAHRNARDTGSGGKQLSQEFRLSRKDLLSARSGGLHSVGSHDSEFLLFNAHPHDVFEEPAESQRTIVIMESCNMCHARRSDTGEGIHTVLAYRRGFSPDALPAPFLSEYDRHQQEQSVINWKQRHYTWGLLQGLWKRDP